MTICGGYVSASSPIDRHVLDSIVQRSPEWPQSESHHYVTRIVSSKIGHLICKHDARRLTPLRVAQDSTGNLLTILGFIRWAKPGTSEHGLLELVAKHGVGALERQEGQFVAVFVEGESGTVHIVNDRFSSRPFYLVSTGGRTFYASSLAFLFKLAQVRPTPDSLGWLQILRFGHTLGKRTNCMGAQRLRPGSHITIGAHSVTERRYWKLEHTPDTGLHPDAFADEVFHFFEASVQWRTRRSPRCIIALSGGLDSRLVAACTPKDVAASAMTFVDSLESTRTAEVFAASEVAKRLGLPHEVRPVESGSYSKTADLVVRLTDGLVPMHHPSKTMQLINTLDTTRPYLLGGGPGDSLAGAFIPGEEYLDASRSEELLTAYCAARTGGWDYLSTIIGDSLLHEFYPKLAESMVDSFADLGGPTAAHRITAWAMSVRQPAFTFTTPFHNHSVFEEGTPHLSYDYTDLMLKLPAAWLLNRNFYGYMIHRLLPELRGVIYANTGRPLSGRLESFDLNAVKESGTMGSVKAIVRKVPFYRHVRRLLPRGRARVMPSFDYSVLRADSALVNSTEEMLDLPGVSTLVDRERCRRFIEAFRTGHVQTSSNDDASVFGSLVTLCLNVKQLQG
jgi:hypothetical protein